ncbi:hypothetical protein [Pseudoduganella rhizocola]|uniref:hypothetical protein n=1 Tax=Pseudoduganella rhizocola TaxID=3382643 RepID=UPI0038B4F44C
MKKYIVYILCVMTLSTCSSWASMFSDGGGRSWYRGSGSSWSSNSGGGSWGGGGGHK